MKLIKIIIIAFICAITLSNVNAQNISYGEIPEEDRFATEYLSVYTHDNIYHFDVDNLYMINESNAMIVNFNTRFDMFNTIEYITVFNTELNDDLLIDFMHENVEVIEEMDGELYFEWVNPYTNKIYTELYLNHRDSIDNYIIHSIID